MRVVIQRVKHAEVIIDGKEKKYSPAQKLVEKDEIANLIKFLLSDQSASITGQEIIIDSGITTNAVYGKR